MKVATEKLEDNILPFLKKSPFFKNLDPENLALLASHARKKKFEPEAIIFQQGTPATFFGVILKGKVKVCRLHPDGKEFILNIFEAGAPIGLLPVFKGEPYPATAIALEETEFLQFNREPLIQFIADHHDFLLDSLAMVGERLKFFVDRAEELSTRQVASRLAGHFLELCCRQNCQTIQLTTKKGDLAGQIGTVSETLSRALKQMEKKRLIQVQGKTVKILDCEKLRILSQGGAG